MSLLTRVKAKQNAEAELRDRGVRFSYLNEAYQRPNFFRMEEAVIKFEHCKMYVNNRTNSRVIVTVTGEAYYLTK